MYAFSQNLKSCCWLCPPRRIHLRGCRQQPSGFRSPTKTMNRKKADIAGFGPDGEPIFRRPKAGTNPSELLKMLIESLPALPQAPACPAACPTEKHKSCYGLRRFKNERDARGFIAWLSEKANVRGPVPYECSLCGQFHIAAGHKQAARNAHAYWESYLAVKKALEAHAHAPIKECTYKSPLKRPIW